MAWMHEQIAAELAAIAEADAALDKRIERLMRNCPPDVKVRIEATSLGTESGYAKDAALLSDLIFEEAEAA